MLKLCLAYLYIHYSQWICIPNEYQLQRRTDIIVIVPYIRCWWTLSWNAQAITLQHMIYDDKQTYILS